MAGQMSLIFMIVTRQMSKTNVGRLDYRLGFGGSRRILPGYCIL